jgi:hypothetical protein
MHEQFRGGKNKNDSFIAINIIINLDYIYNMKDITKVLAYLKENKLVLTTAESCTAGQILSLMG